MRGSARSRQDYFAKFIEVSMNYYRHRLRLDPNDGYAHMRLGRAYSGRPGQRSVAHLQAAARINPTTTGALRAGLLASRIGSEAYQGL